MKKYVKKHRLSIRLAWITIISLLLVPNSTKTVTASQPALSEPETQQEEDKPDIFQVSFPGDTEHVFDFIMDPQKLISQTNAAAYGGSVFEEDATLFFRRRDGATAEDYSSSSDALVIANMGTAEMDLELTASISMDSMEGIVMTDDRDFTDDTDASLYLALTDKEHTVAIGEEGGASICTTLKGVSGENGAVSEYRFWLTGAVNENGDWSEVEGAVPRVTVTWNITPHEVQEENHIQPEAADLPADEGGVENEASGQSDLPQDSKEPGKPGENDPPDNSKEAQGDTEQKEPETLGEGISPEDSKELQGNTDEKDPEPSGESTDPKNPEPSGESTDPKNPESSGESTDPKNPESSEENTDPKNPESSGEHEDSENPEPSAEYTDPKDPKQSEGAINPNPLEPLEEDTILENPESSAEHVGSKEPRSAAEHTDAEGNGPL